MRDKSRGYTCELCGATYDNVEDYINCVNSCAEAFDAQCEEEAKQKRAEEVAAAINKVRQAEIYYKDCLKEFKSSFPEEYNWNFGNTETDNHFEPETKNKNPKSNCSCKHNSPSNSAWNNNMNRNISVSDLSDKELKELYDLIPDALKIIFEL